MKIIMYVNEYSISMLKKGKYGIREFLRRADEKLNPYRKHRLEGTRKEIPIKIIIPDEEEQKW